MTSDRRWFTEPQTGSTKRRSNDVTIGTRSGLTPRFRSPRSRPARRSCWRTPVLGQRSFSRSPSASTGVKSGHDTTSSQHSTESSPYRSATTSPCSMDCVPATVWHSSTFQSRISRVSSGKQSRASGSESATRPPSKNTGSSRRKPSARKQLGETSRIVRRRPTALTSRLLAKGEAA